MSPVTTHILDTAAGKPASNVSVTLEFKKGDSWSKIGNSKTNNDGRVPDLLSDGHKLEKGQYRINFDTKPYFDTNNRETFYPSVSITFEIKAPTEHYHVPLLISGFGYSTYRGS